MQERFGLKKRTLDVRLAPESGHKWLCRGMSAFEPIWDIFTGQTTSTGHARARTEADHELTFKLDHSVRAGQVVAMATKKRDLSCGWRK